MPNTNIKQLYGYILQQMAAESYFEGNELNSIEEIKNNCTLVPIAKDTKLTIPISTKVILVTPA